MKYSIIFILGFFASNIYAQQSSSCYQTHRAQGIKLFEQKMFFEANNKFRASKYACEDCPVDNDIDLWLKKCLDSLKSETQKAIEAKKQAENNLAMVRNLNKKSNEIINLFFNNPQTNKYLYKKKKNEAFDYNKMTTVMERKIDEGKLHDAYLLISFIEYSFNINNELEQIKKTIYEIFSVDSQFYAGNLELAKKNYKKYVDFSQKYIKNQIYIIDRTNRVYESAINNSYTAESRNNTSGQSSLSRLSSKLTNTKKVKSLDLDGLDLVTIPSKIGLQTEIKLLTIRNNQLKSLPTQIGKLKSLETLSLTNNSLETLPDEISKLENLKRIYLNANKFSEEEKRRIKKLLPSDCKAWW